MFTKTYRLMIVAALLLAVVPLAGCSKNVPLKGTVVFSDDGSPLTEGVICFTDGKNMARGDINPDGSFEMGFVGMKDGLPPGQYKVYFWGVGMSGAMSSSPPPDGPMEMDAMGNLRPVQTMGTRTYLIDPKYNDADTSGLEYEITGKTRTLEIKIDRYSPAGTQSR